MASARSDCLRNMSKHDQVYQQQHGHQTGGYVDPPPHTCSANIGVDFDTKVVTKSSHNLFNLLSEFSGGSQSRRKNANKTGCRASSNTKYGVSDK
ncbi:hypothetical protein Bca101_059828 [Brassica carinata]